MNARILVGDCRARMAEMDENSIDAIVTDPPYGLEFMGKEWDRLQGSVSDGSFKDFKLPSLLGSRRNVKCPECGKWGYDWPGAKCVCGGIVRHKQNEMQAWHYEWALAALRVAKPGAFLLAFGGTRTHHRLMCAIEDAGWEIRDCMMFFWVYAQGFPKSHNGTWGGTSLKPSYEPIVCARKPLIGTVAANFERYGTGALNIDACRIGTGENQSRPRGTFPHSDDAWGNGRPDEISSSHVSGRWPANVALDETAAARLDSEAASAYDSSICGQETGAATSSYAGENREAARFSLNPSIVPSGKNGTGRSRPVTSSTIGTETRPTTDSPTLNASQEQSTHLDIPTTSENETATLNVAAESASDGSLPPNTTGAATDDSATARPVRARSDRPGRRRTDRISTPTCGSTTGDGPSRYFYTAKASRHDRNDGLEGMPEQVQKFGGHGNDEDDDLTRKLGSNKPRRNHHPTVKPFDLMRWLVRLVCPPNGTILDPFAGSGSTGVAALAESFNFIGIELSAEYAAIAERRIANVAPMFAQVQTETEKPENPQLEMDL